MYRIATTNLWYNGHRHAGLVAAVTQVKQARAKFPFVQFDVMRDVDREHTRVVYTCDGMKPFTRSK